MVWGFGMEAWVDCAVSVTYTGEGVVLFEMHSLQEVPPRSNGVILGFRFQG